MFWKKKKKSPCASVSWRIHGFSSSLLGPYLGFEKFAVEFSECPFPCAAGGILQSGPYG
jgi:hypothetical protein